jgi:ATPase subunit of ABC transporter with duplicated ATPase domains
VNLQVNWADRVAVTGPNGAGKSGALLGRVPLSSGSASLGPGVSVGEVDQARSIFDGPAPLLAPFSLVAVTRGADPGLSGREPREWPFMSSWRNSAG